MKKKRFTSKLQFQKTTVVSFHSMSNLRGGALVNTDTRILSVDAHTCILTVCGTDDPTTDMNNTCPPPTTRTGITDYCDDGTRKKCNISLLGC